MTREQFNVWAMNRINERGTARFTYRGHTFLIEEECGAYVCWIEGRDSMESLANTPYDAFADMSQGY